MTDTAENTKEIAYCGLYCGDCFGYKQKIADLARDLRKELRQSKFAKTAEALQAAGYETCEDLLAADPEALETIDGVGPKTAEAILDWAAEQAEKPPAETAEVGIELPEGPSTSSMDGDEFMAALSKALKESEQLRAGDDFSEEEEEKAPASDEEEGS